VRRHPVDGNWCHDVYQVRDPASSAWRSSAGCRCVESPSTGVLGITRSPSSRFVTCLLRAVTAALVSVSCCDSPSPVLTSPRPGAHTAGTGRRDGALPYGSSAPMRAPSERTALSSRRTAPPDLSASTARSEKIVAAPHFARRAAAALERASRRLSLVGTASRSVPSSRPISAGFIPRYQLRHR